MDTLRIALEYLHAGLSVIPIKCDGTKAPAVKSWAPYQTRRASEEEARRWYSGSGASHGVAIVCGEASGSLAVLDFDAPGFFERWSTIVEEVAPGVLASLPIIGTPTDGKHVYVRTPKQERNDVLARAKVPNPAKRGDVAIEIRGHGGYVLAPGCPAECHPTRALYGQISGPELGATPALDAETWETLVGVALSLDESGTVRRGPAESVPRGTQSSNLNGCSQQRNGAASAGTDSRPGTDFNRRASWAEILEPLGAVMAYQHDGAQYWRRPGKDTGISASAGKCRGQIGGDLLHVFTSNWPPFLANETLSKFDAYAKLTHAGSHAEAARALARQGYGSDPTSDPAALLEPYTAAVEGPAKEVAKMAFRMRNPHELSPLAPDLVAAVTANMPELARLLARKRVDLASVDPEQTTRRYVSALVCAGVRMRWDPERVVHLVVHWMLTHKLLSELDRLDPKALAEAHAYFAANPHAEDSAGVIEIEVKREDETAAETGADPRDASLDYLRSALKIPIVRVLKSDREDSRYALEIETDPGVTERVEIGTWNAVRVAASFERPIVDRIGVLLPAAATKGASWRKVQIHLLRVVEVEDNDWRKRSEDEELVRDYLEGQTLGDDSGDPERTSWRVSHLAKAPFRRDGRLYLNAASLRAHLSIHRILGVEVRPMLRRLGYRHEQVVSWDPDAGHSVCRSYWSVSCDDVS